MHICFITNEYPKISFPHGGIGSFVYTLSKGLIDQGYHVSVVGLNYNESYEEENDCGVLIYRIKPARIKGIKWLFNSLRLNQKIKEIHQKNPIDIIETSELGLAFLHKIHPIKYIIRLHGGHHFFAEAEERGINFWKGFQEKQSFKKADAFIAVSKYVQSHTETLLSFHNKPISLICNPVNTNLFTPVICKEKKDTIVFVGTVCEKKGIRQLINAFAIVKKSFPNVVLEIYGRDWLFPDGSSYIQKLRENELVQLGSAAQAVYFYGTVPYINIPFKYAQATVCVFPSQMETVGLVVLEAMAMEKPVVFTNKGSGPEIIKHGKTGLLCDPYSPNDIAAKIMWVLNNNEDAKSMAIAARKEVLHTFSLPHILEENIQFYTDIIKNQ
ncbi:glycosyltransferase involved in cell wall biosynthesis [Flavobacterium sp. PL11]|uniref:glycosyltransferase family 4 protein n=1 Tax=Flavobacterium sp. PL11 TaxID=3071717 RepID=UPI002E09A697|nr:glycosyltransferase involved in cell wall biosynthesis [Flavobacterium sp. PL11]